MNRTATIKKLEQIFKKGYIPSRQREPYYFLSPSGFDFGVFGNCFEHACFNLTNAHFVEYNFTIDDYFNFTRFYEQTLNPELDCINKMANFITNTGLKFEKALDKMTLKPNQWKVALYFSKSLSDFHFLLKENDNLWSSKLAYEPFVERYKKLPKSLYYTSKEKHSYSYKLYDTFILTNKNAEIIK